jgi:hypothetical protein
MKLLQKFNEKSREWIADFENKNHVKYTPEMNETLPYYVLIDDNMKVQTKEELQYNEEKLGFDRVQIPVTFVQADINYFKSVGQLIEVFDKQKIADLEAEKQAFVDLLKAAKLEGYEQAKKEFKIKK